METEVSRQYKYTCCNLIGSSNVNPETCPVCGRKAPILEEIDKEDMVFVTGYSGDKKHEERQWGNFTILLDQKGVKVKKIVVKPDQRLSLQLHTKRKELWYIVSGSGTVQVGNEEYQLESGDTININKYEVHRVKNNGLINLVFIEIQSGNCQEDDIIRIDDDYGRV